ncbi:MAG: ribosome silencing factor [Rhodospirillaceae bacterium]|nr:ribosome silencing factor [Rhodospirillaceae bacterium]
MSGRELTELVLDALDELKAQAVKTMDVRHLTTVTDMMIIATGRSARHVRALAETVAERCKRAGVPPLGREGEAAGEWVLLDLADVVVHVMQPEVREFYDLEKLWDIPAQDQALN